MIKWFYNSNDQSACFGGEFMGPTFA